MGEWPSDAGNARSASTIVRSSEPSMGVFMQQAGPWGRFHALFRLNRRVDLA